MVLKAEIGTQIFSHLSLTRGTLQLIKFFSQINATGNTS